MTAPRGLEERSHAELVEMIRRMRGKVANDLALLKAALDRGQRAHDVVVMTAADHEKAEVLAGYVHRALGLAGHTAPREPDAA